MHNHNYDTLVEAQMGTRDRGYTEEYIWDDEQFKNADKTKSYSPSDLKIIEEYRFEGMTNPGDMSIFFVIEGKDGTKGYATSGYGTYADEKFVKFLDEIEKVDSTTVSNNP